MRLVRILVAKLAILLVFVHGESLPAQGSALGLKDVHAVMGQVLNYHVDQDTVSSKIIKRSFVVYINQFDPERIYLTQEEVDKFTNLDEARYTQILHQYLANDFSTYVELNAILAKSIERSRKWRTQLALKIKQVFQSNWSGEPLDPYEKRPFAANEKELQERLYNHLKEFLEIQKQRTDSADLLGRELELMGFYERQMRPIEKHYLGKGRKGKALSEVEQEHWLTIHILKALTKSLDAHTAFFSPQEAYDMRVRLQKGFDGIGVVLQEGIDGVFVTRLIKEGPAERSGLILESDRLIEVNGQAIGGMSFDQILDLVRGRTGTTVVLGLVREGGEGDRFFNVELAREPIELDDNRISISYEHFGDGIIGKIVLYAFYEGESGISSERDIQESIDELKKIGKLKGLVLDFRQNMGGFLMQAVKVTGLFINSGVVVVSKYADGIKRYFRDIDGRNYYDGPLLVLTSRASASAAEIVAQALQDYGSALVVGDKRTYGKGSIQHQTVTEGNRSSHFKVTVGRYYTVSGKSTQISGVKADIVIPTIYHEEKIGEEFLDFPLSEDIMQSSYQDSLEDLDADARSWYERHYLPSLEQVDHRWRTMLPTLQKNSTHRLQNSLNFQAFLDSSESLPPEDQIEFGNIRWEDEHDFGQEDLQMKEAINIMKDMIILKEDSLLSSPVQKLSTPKQLIE